MSSADLPHHRRRRQRDARSAIYSGARLLKWSDWILPPPRFETALEKEYLSQWRLTNALRLQWLSGWMATAMYVGALTADYLFGHRIADPFLFCLFAVVSLSMTLLLTFARFHADLARQAYAVAFGTLLVNGCALIAVTAITRQAGNPFPQAWLLVLLIYTFVSTGMPYRYCVPLGVSLGVLDISVAIAQQLPASQMADHMLLEVSVVMTGIIACSTLERGDRLGWMRALQMQKQSHSDDLTGLRNRRYLFEEGVQRIAHAVRERLPIALMMIDVDYFKRYNDALGHPVGDACLRQLSETMMSSVNHPLDIVVRLGGEEFAVLLFACEQADVLRSAETLRQAIETLSIAHPNAPSGRVTVSIGVAASGAFRPAELQSLLLHADKALYRAKESGRNSVSV